MFGGLKLSLGFKTWLATTDDRRPLSDYRSVLEGAIIQIEQLEAENERWRKAWARLKRWAENKRKYEEAGGDPEYEKHLAKERAEAEEILNAIYKG